MIRNLSFINLAELFERFAYYGVRAILLLFLVNKLHVLKEDAVSWYGTFTVVGYVISIFAGLIGDLLSKPALVALIGSSLSTAGIFLLSVSGNFSMAMVSMMLIAVGSGTYKPNVLNTVFRVSAGSIRHIDLIVSIFYLAINIGAFLAPVVVGAVGDTGNPDDYTLGFMVAGCASLSTTILFVLNYKNMENNQLLPYTGGNNLSVYDTLWILGSIVAVIVFWCAYELIPWYTISGGGYDYTMLSMIVMFASAVIIIPLNLIPGLRASVKLAIGLGLSAIALLSAAFNLVSGYAGPLIIVSCEFLVAPILMSQLMTHCSPRFIGTLMGFYMAVTMITNKISGELTAVNTGEHPLVLFSLSAFLITTIAVFLIADYQKRRSFPSAGTLL